MQTPLGTGISTAVEIRTAHEEIQVPQRPAGNNVGRMMHVQRHPGTPTVNTHSAPTVMAMPSKPAVQHGQQDG